MTVVRKDAFTGAYVLVSEERGKRPIATAAAGDSYIETPPRYCPFCPGREHMTPKPLMPGEENWQTRFFINKYPALVPEPPPICGHGEDVGFYEGFLGTGGHEIFVDTRSHTDNLKDFSVAHIAEIIRGLAGRYRHYLADADIKYIQIFKNKGARAGASQSHSHWQLVAGGFVPQMQETLTPRLARYAEETGGCLYCAVLAHELREGRRVVFDNGPFAAFTPYASRFSYETWLMPKRHFSSLSEIEDEEITALAEALKRIALSFERVRENVDYNVLLMDAPKTHGRHLFHWHVQITPKMGALAGYEYSTGSYINHITPEKAAERLASGGK